MDPTPETDESLLDNLMEARFAMPFATDKSLLENMQRLKVTYSTPEAIARALEELESRRSLPEGWVEALGPESPQHRSQKDHRLLDSPEGMAMWLKSKGWTSADIDEFDGMCQGEHMGQLAPESNINERLYMCIKYFLEEPMDEEMTQVMVQVAATRVLQKKKEIAELKEKAQDKLAERQTQAAELEEGGARLDSPSTSAMQAARADVDKAKALLTAEIARLEDMETALDRDWRKILEEWPQARALLDAQAILDKRVDDFLLICGWDWGPCTIPRIDVEQRLQKSGWNVHRAADSYRAEDRDRKAATKRQGGGVRGRTRAQRKRKSRRKSKKKKSPKKKRRRRRRSTRARK